MRVLLVEDDRAVAGMIRLALVEDGFAVDHALTGMEGRTLAFVNAYDAIVLDLVLPDLHGLQLLQELRRAGRTVPILVLTADRDPETMVRSLDTGADDFVVKPVGHEELRARVRALVRRGGAIRLETIHIGRLVLNRLTRQVLHDGRPIVLTKKEFNLLEHFVLRVNDVVTRADLLEKIWDLHFDPGSNVLDVHVARLRRKLEKLEGAPQLVTMRGSGYRLVCAEGAERTPAP